MKKINNKTKRKIRNRKKLKKVNVNKLRISVSKSLNNLSAQIIDDKQNKTLVSASSFEKDIRAKKINNKIKRKFRNRKKLKDVNNNRLRITVTKSLNNLSAQIIDDKEKKTIVSASSIEKEIKLKKIKKMEKSSLIGEILAKRAKEKNILEVYFDRGENKYHGRIKLFAETLRKNGLKF